MKTSDKGLIFLTGLEGVCTNLYLDSVGVRTIGVGATVSEIPNIKQLPWSYEITIQEAFDLLKKSIVKYENAVNKALTVEIAQYKFDALVSICYNIGIGGLAKSTFIKRINTGCADDAVCVAIMMWNKPKEILGRRQKETGLYRTGNYGDGKANHFPVSSTSHKPVYSKGKIIKVEEYI